MSHFVATACEARRPRLTRPTLIRGLGRDNWGRVVRTPSLPAFAGLVLLAATAGYAQAPESAVQFTGFSAFAFGNYSIGWTFTVNQPLQVSSLGCFDYNSDGFAGPHAVGIWNSSGALLVSTTVPASTAAPLGPGVTGSDGFRYVAISPVLLAGGTYTIDGVSNRSDMFLADVTDFGTSPLITYGLAYYSDGAVLV
jgi:hypothetical protein